MNEHEPSQKPLNLLFSTWLHPRLSARDVIHNKSIGYILFIITFGYMGSIASGLIDSKLYPDFPLWGVIVLLFTIAPILGIISTSLYALIIWLTGKLFKGVATYKEVFKSLSIINIPYIVLIPIVLIWMLVDPSSLFDATNSENYGFIIVTYIVAIITTIWCFIINIAVVAEVEQLSNWKAFFTIVIPTLALSFIVFILVIIIAFIAVAVGGFSTF